VLILSHCGPLPGGLARMEGAPAAAARATALVAADVLGPTVVGRVAARPHKGIREGSTISRLVA
jgi:hypothetical protein